jgi:hypothetical protein
MAHTKTKRLTTPGAKILVSTREENSKALSTI